MREALGVSDLVLHLLQVSQKRCLLLLRLRWAAPVTRDGLLHGDVHRVRFQGLVVHSCYLSARGQGEGSGEDGAQRSVIHHTSADRTNLTPEASGTWGLVLCQHVSGWFN